VETPPPATLTQHDSLGPHDDAPVQPIAMLASSSGVLASRPRFALLLLPLIIELPPPPVPLAGQRVPCTHANDVTPPAVIGQHFCADEHFSEPHTTLEVLPLALPSPPRPFPPAPPSPDSLLSLPPQATKSRAKMAMYALMTPPTEGVTQAMRPKIFTA
jgi:hypothetical protein